MKSFTDLENQKINKDTVILLDVIKARLENMDVFTRDWAYWDDAYSFVQNRNPRFAQTAISPSICKDTNSNFVVIANPRGEILLAKGFDFEKNQKMPIPQSLKEIIDQPHISRLTDKNSRTLGLIVLPEGLLMISVRGILKTDYTGPSKGAILFARYLDAREVKRLSEMAHLDFTLFEVDNRHWDPRISTLLNKFKTKNPIVIEPVNSTMLHCYVQLRDIFNQPAVIFRISMPRDIYQQGRHSFYLLFIAIVIIGIIYLIITSYIVDRAILKRLMRFIDDIKIIANQAKLTHRLQIIGNDEFTSLSKNTNSMLDALQQAENTKNNFLAVISHEIRTPINGIVGMLELLKREQLTPKQSKLVSAAASSVKILHTLVNDILDYSKLRAGKIILAPIVFNLYELLTDIRIIAEPLAEQKNIKVDFIFPANYETQYFYADEFRLRQVLLNILNNALKFTTAGKIIIETKLKPQADQYFQVNIAIKDTGTGIPTDKLDKVFEFFEQADSSIARKHGGSGLGLTICKEIIEMMHGTITVKPHQPQGSEFCIELVLAKAVPAKAIPQDSTPVLPVTLTQPRILIAEDNAVNILYLTSLLEESGCQVDTVLSGQEALWAVSKNNYALILMDIHMPDMDGLTAAKEIRKQGLTMPIITISADVSPLMLEKINQAGMNDFLGKPYTSKELEIILRKYGITLDKVPKKIQPLNTNIYNSLYQAMQQQNIPEQNIQNIITQTKLALNAYINFIQKEQKKPTLDWVTIINKTHSLKGTLSVFSAFENELLNPYVQQIIELYATAKTQDQVNFEKKYALFFDAALLDFIGLG